MRLGLPVRIGAAAAVLALALTGLVVREGMARAAGQEAVLAIQGYDPRELLTGHFVQFQLQDLASPGIACPRLLGPAEQDWRWIALRRDGVRHRPAAVATTRAEALRYGQIAVRGSVHCFRITLGGLEGRSTEEHEVVSLNIGIDRFHTDQVEAEAIQKALAARSRDPTAYAAVSVGRDGRARLKGLIVNGRRIDLDWF